MGRKCTPAFRQVCRSQAQVLAEMDEEFGVSNLVDATFKHEKEKVGVVLVWIPMS